MDRAAEVREIVRRVLDIKGDRNPFSDDASLLISGRLASIDVLEVVLGIEERFGVDFSDRPFDQNAFDSVQGILRLVDDDLSRR